MKILLSASLIFVSSTLFADGSLVRVQGLFKDKALVTIDGARHLMRKGQTINGVTLLDANGRGATLQFASGEQRTLGLNQQISSAFSKREEIKHTLYASRSGMFYVDGMINGKLVDFVLDTGATYVSLSQNEADRLGLSYRSGSKTTLSTANGVVNAWNITLESVKVGGIRVPQVGAVVLPGNSPDVALLGMSFLNHLKMHRNGAAMTLQQKY